MIKVLIDENLSEYFAEGLNQLQKPLGNHIEVTSIAKESHDNCDSIAHDKPVHVDLQSRRQ